MEASGVFEVLHEVKNRVAHISNSQWNGACFIINYRFTVHKGDLGG
jgi:hypothetical protein